MQEIAKNVFVEQEYEGANVGCVLTEAGAIVIDTPIIPAEARDWVDKVSQLTDTVLYVFNTDHQHIFTGRNFHSFFNNPYKAFSPSNIVLYLRENCRVVFLLKKTVI